MVQLSKSQSVDLYCPSSTGFNSGPQKEGAAWMGGSGPCPVWDDRHLMRVVPEVGLVKGLSRNSVWLEQDL